MADNKFINEGSEYMETSEENICISCKFLLDPKLKQCLAFEKIPDEIWEQEFIHTEKYKKQDNDIIFEHK